MFRDIRRHVATGRPSPHLGGWLAGKEQRGNAKLTLWRYFELVGIDINIDGTRCHRVIYVLEQARFIVSCEGRNLPILITS